MPGNLLTMDTGFPQFRSGQSESQKLQAVMDYLFMIREQLTYTLNNLGVNNFNTQEITDLGAIITEPITAKIRDADGNIGLLWAAADEIATSLENTEGQLSALTQKVDGFALEVTDANSNIGLLWVAADEIATSLENTDGRLSALTQKVDSFTLEVTDEGESSTIKLMANGAEISSQEITLSGLVTLKSLNTAGATTINGSNITTGTISAVTISGCTWESRDERGYGVIIQKNWLRFMYGNLTAVSLYMNEEGDFSAETAIGYNMHLTSDALLDLTSAKSLTMTSGEVMKLASGDNLSIDASGAIYIGTSNGFDADIYIGKNGKDLKLVGNVYVNGVLLA